jgi:hypothetical protein
VNPRFSSSLRVHFKDPGIDGEIILNGSPGSWLGAWIGLLWLRIGCYASGDEVSVSIKHV